MALARFGAESDVYVMKMLKSAYAPSHQHFNYTCCGCSHDEESFYAVLPIEMKNHLLEHIARGEKVPDHTLDRLDREQVTYDG